MQNTDVNKQEREVLELLQDYPAPAADGGFYERALLRATHEGSRRQRNRWMMTGFGSAVHWNGAPLPTQLPDAESAIPGVTIALAEPRTINLMFASRTALDSATLTVTLPDGIELDGFPGQREITWETSLSEGKNLLPLELVALTPAGGEVLARLEHDNRGRTFRLRVNIS